MLEMSNPSICAGLTGNAKAHCNSAISACRSIFGDGSRSNFRSRAVRAMLPEAHFATVYAKPAGRPTVDSYITEVSQDTWILFPWDQEAVMAKTVLELKGGQ